MSYTSLVYLAFVLVTVLFYFILPKRIRPYVLLVASFLFYFLHSERLMLIPLFSSTLIYLCARKITAADERFAKEKADLDKQQSKELKTHIKKVKKRWLLLALLSNVGILFVFKYYNSFGSGVNVILSLFNIAQEIPKFKILAPLGISYYTLQSLSYVIDVHRGQIKADKNYMHVLLFVFYFPQIMEGPIGRYNDLAPQLYKANVYDFNRIRQGLLIILWGFFKKVVIADRAGIFANEIFKAPEKYDGTMILIGIILFTLQLYGDFSGIIDISVGISKIFGIDLAPNFNQPFFSKNIQEFWRRWHITLGLWLKDYVFYSVSLSKPLVAITKKVRKRFKGHFAKTLPAALSLFFVWLFNGIWHGAGKKYIFYGMYYYVLMLVGMFMQPMIDKTLSKLKINKDSKPYGVFQMIRTFIVVLGGMMIFRAQSLSHAGLMFKKIFTNFKISSIVNGALLQFKLSGADFVVLIVMTALLGLVSTLKEKGHNPIEMVHAKALPIRWTIYFVLLFTILIFGIYGEGYTVLDPIYGQF